MDIFAFRDSLIADYRYYIESFLRIHDPKILAVVQRSLDEGALWPEPLLQLNPCFAPGETKPRAFEVPPAVLERLA